MCATTTTTTTRRRRKMVKRQQTTTACNAYFNTESTNSANSSLVSHSPRLPSTLSALPLASFLSASSLLLPFLLSSPFAPYSTACHTTLQIQRTFQSVPLMAAPPSNNAVQRATSPCCAAVMKSLIGSASVTQSVAERQSDRRQTSRSSHSLSDGERER